MSSAWRRLLDDCKRGLIRDVGLPLESAPRSCSCLHRRKPWPAAVRCFRRECSHCGLHCRFGRPRQLCTQTGPKWPILSLSSFPSFPSFCRCWPGLAAALPDLGPDIAAQGETASVASPGSVRSACAGLGPLPFSNSTGHGILPRPGTEARPRSCRGFHEALLCGKVW